MPRENYHVILSADEEQRLKDITHKGKSFSVKEILHENIFLLTNENVQKK